MRCATCGEVFGGESTFDRHRVGDFEKGHMATAGKKGKGKRQPTAYVVDSPNTRRCLSAAEMVAKGFVQDEKGVWRRVFRKEEAA